MVAKQILSLVMGAVSMLAFPATGQEVYQCGRGSRTTYTHVPCDGRVVNTDEAPVRPSRAEIRRAEQNRLLAQSLRRRPDETVAQFDTRRHRARLLATDREECARLDKRMPVEEASVNNPDPERAQDAQEALAKSRKRFAALRC